MNPSIEQIEIDSQIDITEQTIDQLHPWLGLASFSEETVSIFYGREEEVAELSRRVQRGPITDGADSQMLHFKLAQSLFFSALTQPKADGKELAEAANLINKLPAALQNYRTIKLWRGRINDEIRLNTRATLGSTSSAKAP